MRVGRCNGDDGAGLIVGRAAAGGRGAAGHMQSAGRGDGMVSDEGDVKTSYIGIVRHGDVERLGVKASVGGDTAYTGGFDVISIIADGDGELGFGRGLYVRANKCKVLVWLERDVVLVIDTMGSACIPWGRVSAGDVIMSSIIAALRIIPLFKISIFIFSSLKFYRHAYKRSGAAPPVPHRSGKSRSALLPCCLRLRLSICLSVGWLLVIQESHEFV